MNERVHVTWNVVVDHEGDAVNVDATSSDVGGDDGLDFAFLEGIENTLSLVLAEVAVQAGDIKAVLLESLNRQVDHALGVAEDDGLVVVLHSDEKTAKHPEFI